MLYEKKNEDDFTVINIKCNNIDYANANDLTMDLTESLKVEDQKIILDLINVEFIGSSGLIMFINLKRKVEKDGGKFALINVGDQLKETIVTTFNVPELLKSFPMFKTKDDAKNFLNS